MLKAEAVRVLGMMSGASLDGVDAAVLLTDGEVIHDFGPSAYRPYTDSERAVLRAAMGQWPGQAGVEEAAEIVETVHAQIMARFDDIALAGFHGLTLAHDPLGRGSHQAGSGAVLALVSGVPVVWDFRSSDMRLGGQGAPLAPFYHFALARRIGAGAPVVFLHLGGVAKVSWVDPSFARPEDPGALLAFHTGSGTAPIDDLCLARLGLPCDDGGALAASGQVDGDMLAKFLADPYFLRVPPKALSRPFAGLVEQVAHLGDADAAATLSECAAAAVAEAFLHFPTPPERVLVSGGGRHNTDLMGRIAARLTCPLHLVEDLGLDGDMLEAQAFAYLAVRVARGLPTSCPGTTGVAAAVGGGQISAP